MDNLNKDSCNNGNEVIDRHKVLSKRVRIHIIYSTIIVCLCIVMIFILCSNNTGQYKDNNIEASNSVMDNGSNNYEESKQSSGEQIKGSNEKKSVGELSKILIDKFYSNFEPDKKVEVYAENESEISYYADTIYFNTVVNTSKWLTLSFFAHPNDGTALDSNYYNIDRRTDRFVNLSDLFIDDSFSEVIVQEIEKQIEKMEISEKEKYYPECLSGGIRRDHDFYIGNDGRLVVVFKKHEIAIGAQGCPEFVIPKDVIVNILNNEFIDIIS